MRILFTGLFTLVVILNSIEILSGASPRTRDFLQCLEKPLKDANHQEGEMKRRPTSLSLPPNFAGRSRVYLHLPDDRVFIGMLERTIWIRQPNPAYLRIGRIYIRWNRHQSLGSIIHPWPHHIDINDDVHEEPRCLILSRCGDFLSASLHRYNSREQLPNVNRPLIFVRIPGDNIVYMGVLKRDNGRRPSWFI
ncbi:uncharacterized protein LOC117171723 [Belonocnema kinseyi]|uniref:uncharacterized protein LOC117171723 n=1 Tax=Belonocnema kinseyi TaxID=2817044 RepID=UPI00143D2EFE|nr:uncharacterized protein LOC117171723 [Belonocnema kinseyi]